MAHTGSSNNDEIGRFQRRYATSSEMGPTVTTHILQRPKFHHLTICMVPPDSNEVVWNMVTKCRTELRDPGLFRWPPHVNLLYPFLEIRPEINTRESMDDTTIDSETSSMSNTSSISISNTKERPLTVHPEILHGLATACSQCAPFRVQLQRFDTFGNKNRGVLWLHPDSSRTGDVRALDDQSATASNSPLMQLQSLLVQSFPTCNDQNMKSSTNTFQPHMTVSHFASHDDALAAQSQIEQWWPTNDANLSFFVDSIYLLQRQGDSGQFLRVADIPLGSTAGNDASTEVIVHDPHIPFRHMPTLEESWVLEERIQLKQRRNGRSSKGSHRSERDSRGSRDNPNRVKDSPDVIEAKRAARKAKRESSAGYNAIDNGTATDGMTT